MDELIEHLQINLGKNFGYEDDNVIEKLRDVMHELRSSRLDYAGNFESSPRKEIMYWNKTLPGPVLIEYYYGTFIGRPPPDELPQVPFGPVPTTLPSSQDTLGVRMPLSEKEREISKTRIMQIEANEAKVKSRDYRGNQGMPKTIVY